MDKTTTAASLLMWVCMVTVAFVYLGYPMLLALWPIRRRPTGARTPAPARVTVLIAAYNEVPHIADTVRNKLSQNYPPELLDVIVVSDGSTDGTDEAVRAIGDPRVVLLRQEPRQGKTAALNRAAALARGDLLVFSDANSRFEPDAVRELAAAFTDPGVGYATGRLIYLDPGQTAVGEGSGIYIRYENWLRRLESAVGSVVGVNGGVDAVRRSLYEPMRPDQLPDFVLPLRVVERGSRVVYREEAVARESALGRQHDEFRMRVRVSLRALHALFEMRGLLHPRHGLFALQLFVHKVLRYLLFLPLAVGFAANLVASATAPYGLILAPHAAFYLLAGIGWISGGRIRWKLIFVPYYFCLINLASAAALIRFLRGERQVVWMPRTGA